MRNNKFQEQSFEIIAARYGLECHFDSAKGHRPDNYWYQEKCQACGLAIASPCRCGSFSPDDRGCCTSYRVDEPCGGVAPSTPVCQCGYEDQQREPCLYVSIYDTVECYGGPEEGGWWYSKSYIMKSFKCESAEQASDIRQEMLSLAEDINERSKRQHDESMLSSMEWLEARGLDADFLPEPDGEVRMWIVVERYPGKHHTGDYRPHYS